MAGITSRPRRWASTRTARSSGFHVDTIANIGAYVSLFATATPTYLYGTLWSGTYDIPAIYGTVRAVTPTPFPSMPIAARGGPRPPT
jgi:carbon-monoxide dehydrogenase large subunit